MTSLSTTPTVTHDPPISFGQKLATMFPRLLAGVLVIFTFLLITMGGLVTSWNAGMSVPDWPTSFGGWAFIPIHLWADFAVLLEHNHRLMGAVSGLVAIAVYLLTARRAGWGHPITHLAGAVLLLYIVQGLFGGFRVTENSIPLALVHGVLGQVILGMTVALYCLYPKPGTKQRTTSTATQPPAYALPVRISLLVLVGLVVAQLILGTWVRQTGSAPAIPDAPATFGQILPPMSQDELNRKFREYRPDDWLTYADINPELSMDAIYTSATPNLLENSIKFAAPGPDYESMLYHFAHRVGAVVLLVYILTLAAILPRDKQAFSYVRWPMLCLLGLLVVQIVLGLSVIWSKENPNIATGHQAVGALFLACSVWLCIRAYHVGARDTDQPVDLPKEKAATASA